MVCKQNLSYAQSVPARTVAQLSLDLTGLPPIGGWIALIAWTQMAAGGSSQAQGLTVGMHNGEQTKGRECMML